MFKKFLDWLNEEDKKPKERFPDKDSVRVFLDGEIDSKYEALIDRWFFVSNRKDIINASERLKKRYDEMRNHFDLFVDSVFVCVRCEEDLESKARSDSYVSEFDELMNAFEKFVYSSVATRISESNNVRNRVKVELEEDA